MEIKVESKGTPGFVADSLYIQFEEKWRLRCKVLAEAGKGLETMREQGIYSSIAYSILDLASNLQYEKGTIKITLTVDCNPPL